MNITEDNRKDISCQEEFPGNDLSDEKLDNVVGGMATCRYEDIDMPTCDGCYLQTTDF